MQFHFIVGDDRQTTPASPVTATIASDFDLYTNLPGARLSDVCRRHIITEATRTVMRTINSIGDLRQQIHNELRIQHPEWVLPNGESPICDAYKARLTNLLALASGPSCDARAGMNSVSEINSRPR